VKHVSNERGGYFVEAVVAIVRILRHSRRHQDYAHQESWQLAIIAGLVHGVAGPGGVLDVIPAVDLRDPKLATMSILVVGTFAIVYGSFITWLAGGSGSNRVFLVEAGSATLNSRGYNLADVVSHRRVGRSVPVKVRTCQ
jgi:hypothetical protein